MRIIVNILTIDVEDYFQVENLKKYIDYSRWDDFPCRVVNNTALILQILEKHDVKATFFVLGWLAERYPEMVEMIYEQGHEVATHGYRHTLIYKQLPEEFREDLLKSIEIIEGIIKEPVLGYRAPAFSIVEDTIWALDVIKEAGLVYDASISPTEGHDRYGIKGSKTFVHKLRNGLYEFPQSTIKVLGRRYPGLGGGYFRLFPYFLTRFFIDRIKRRNEEPAIIYLHPWEFDPEQPVVEDINFKVRFRHYLNLGKTKKRFIKMLEDFKFTSIKDYLDKSFGISK